MDDEEFEKRRQQRGISTRHNPINFSITSSSSRRAQQNGGGGGARNEARVKEEGDEAGLPRVRTSDAILYQGDEHELGKGDEVDDDGQFNESSCDSVHTDSYLHVGAAACDRRDSSDGISDDSARSEPYRGQLQQLRGKSDAFLKCASNMLSGCMNQDATAASLPSFEGELPSLVKVENNLTAN